MRGIRLSNGIPKQLIYKTISEICQAISVVLYHISVFSAL